jgi:hypothetical protein
MTDKISKADLTEKTLSKMRQPEYKRLDIEPKMGGQSLFHDEFGLPKSATPKKKDILPINEISNMPILMKASQPSENITFKKSQVSKISIGEVEDDKFIPPKSNFVSIGHVEHAWYDDKAAGISVDNNDHVDVESLQGLNPLVKNVKSLEFFTKRLAYITNFTINELIEVDSLEGLSELKTKIFGKHGLFTELLKQVGDVEPNYREKIGVLINKTYSDIQLEIQGKSIELETEAEDDEENLEWPEDMAVITKPDDENQNESEDEEVVEEDEDNSNVESKDSSIPEGWYAVIVDGKLLEVVESIEIARDCISQLILNDNIALDNIQLIKRIKIDFGIILG